MSVRLADLVLLTRVAAARCRYPEIQGHFGGWFGIFGRLQVGLKRDAGSIDVLRGQPAAEASSSDSRRNSGPIQAVTQHLQAIVSAKVEIKIVVITVIL